MSIMTLGALTDMARIAGLKLGLESVDSWG